MNALNSTGRVNLSPDSQDRPVVVEIVTENDALDDLTSAIDLTDGLVRDCNTHLLWLTDNPKKRPERRNAVRLWKDDPNLLDALRVLFGIVRPDIVHTHRFNELATVGQAARRAGVANIIHSVSSEIIAAGKSQLDEYAAVVKTLSPLLIASNDEAAVRLSSWAPVYNLSAGIDCERYAPGDQALARRKVGLPNAPRVIGCGSPLHGLGALLHALYGMNSEIHLALFGQARPMPAERNLIKQLGLEERVHVLGAWAKQELILQAIDVYFHGPSDDCLARVVLAAQACGTPAIACAPTPSNMLCPQTGHLTHIQHIPALLDNLRRALGPARSKVTRQFILENWNADRSLEGYSALFRQLANQRQKVRVPA